MDPHGSLRGKVKISAYLFFGLGVFNIVLSLAIQEAIYIGIIFGVIYAGIGAYTLTIAQTNEASKAISYAKAIRAVPLLGFLQVGRIALFMTNRGDAWEDQPSPGTIAMTMIGTFIIIALTMFSCVAAMRASALLAQNLMVYDE